MKSCGSKSPDSCSETRVWTISLSSSGLTSLEFRSLSMLLSIEGSTLPSSSSSEVFRALRSLAPSSRLMAPSSTSCDTVSTDRVLVFTSFRTSARLVKSTEVELTGKLGVCLGASASAVEQVLEQLLQQR
ncbi:MAG: hypothetical protein QW503_04575 [Sulfolobales archaeon]